MKFQNYYASLDTCWTELPKHNDYVFSEEIFDGCDIRDFLEDMFKQRCEEPGWKLLYKQDQFSDFIEAD